MTEAPLTEQSSKNPERDKAIRSAYAIATKRLREAHLDEFRQYQIEAAAEQGVTYTPPPTKDEKDEAALIALLEGNPNLKARIVEELGAG